jgi:hypothetical protein
MAKSFKGLIKENGSIGSTDEFQKMKMIARDIVSAHKSAKK